MLRSSNKLNNNDDYRLLSKLEDLQLTICSNKAKMLKNKERFPFLKYGVVGHNYKHMDYRILNKVMVISQKPILQISGAHSSSLDIDCKLNRDHYIIADLAYQCSSEQVVKQVNEFIPIRDVCNIIVMDYLIDYSTTIKDFMIVMDLHYGQPIPKEEKYKSVWKNQQCYADDEQVGIYVNGIFDGMLCYDIWFG